MIPDEAVEAAARAGVNHFRELSPNLAAALDGQADMFRAALEAAAPHLMAKAWDEGANAAWGRSNEGYNGSYPNPGEPFDALPNPYRKSTNV